MRSYVLVLLGACFALPAAAHAQSTAAKPQTPPAAATPAAPPKPNAERKEIKVPEKVLKSYVGEYEMAPERILTITLENGSLFGQPTNQSKRQMYPEAPTKFFLKDLEVQITFQKDARGKVTGLIMDQQGRPRRELKKVK